MHKITVEFEDGEKHEITTDQFVLLVENDKKDIDCLSHSSDKFVVDCMMSMTKVLEG